MPVFTGQKINFFGGGSAVSGPDAEYAEATGGIIGEYTTPTGDIYRSHTFTAPGTLTVSSIGNAPGGGMTYDILAVGGGGGGGTSGGGGGGGMVVYAEDQTLVAQGYPVTVGQGGRGGPNSPGTNSTASGTNGGTSSFASPTATLFYAPGGGGGGGHTQDGKEGGSGGGCGRDAVGTAGDGEGNPHPGGIDVVSPSPQSTTSGFGRPGGVGPSNSGPACGGGGGGGAGTNGGVARDGPTNTTQYGLGGDGARYTIGNGVSIYYGAGGGGGNQPPTPVPFRTNAGTGNPGANGGHTMFSNPSPSAADDTKGGVGVSGVGGGGGGAAGSGGSTFPGAFGGDGTVIVRYKIGATHSASASGGVISAYGGKIIHTFTNSGTFTTDAGFNKTVEYVIVGGGGGGGWDVGGGGGSGGYKTDSIPINTPTSTPMAVTVGKGGGFGFETEAAAAPNNDTYKCYGESSIVVFPTGTITMGGGGGGGMPPDNPGGPGIATGGSGGGGRGNTDSNAGATPGPGNAGGAGPSGKGGGGGGGQGGEGQDGGAGPNASPTSGGNGGGGIQLPTTFRNPDSTVAYPGPGPSGFWVAGGGGGSCLNTGPVGSGGGSPDWSDPWAGAGYGGKGTPQFPATGARANSGSGGGGGASQGTAVGRSAGQGGSGLVLIAYPE